MASLAAKPHVIASLNAMLASETLRRGVRPPNNEEIADLVIAMAENNTAASHFQAACFEQWSHALVKSI